MLMKKIKLQEYVLDIRLITPKTIVAMQQFKLYIVNKRFKDETLASIQYYEENITVESGLSILTSILVNLIYWKQTQINSVIIGITIRKFSLYQYNIGYINRSMKKIIMDFAVTYV